MSIEKRALYLLSGKDCYNCAYRVSISESVGVDYDSPEIYLAALPEEGIDVYPKIEDICFKHSSPHALDFDRICENWMRKNYES